MTSFRHGDRIRYATMGDDGYPVVRYGFVGGVADDDGPVVVMLDGELGGDVVDLTKIEPVSISNVTLTLEGTDLIEDPLLRQGLMNLWAAEAESAGLQIVALKPLNSQYGVRDSSEGYTLAELSSAGEHYVLRASLNPGELDAVTIHATPPSRF